MSRPREWTLRLVVESLLVVFSILLALALNQWRDEREYQRRVVQVRAGFVAEIMRNRNRLVEALPFHRRMHARFDTLYARGSVTNADVGKVWSQSPGGVRFVRLSDAVWRSVAGSDLLQRIPWEETLLVADVYRQQEEIDSFNRGIADAWREATADWNQSSYARDDLRRTRAYLGDVIGAEERLLDLYSKALEQLEPQAGDHPVK